MNQQANQQRPWLPTVILLGVAVLLAAFSIWVVPLLNKPSESDDTQTTSIPLFEFEGSAVRRITVTKGFLMTTVERPGAGEPWRVVAPSPDEADQNRLTTLANTVAGMQATRALEGVSLETFGLLEPAAQVTLELGDETTVEFKIGDQNPGGTSRYVQVEGDARVHLIPVSQVSGLLDMVDNPPYPPTPTPPPSPVETPEDEPTATPEETVAAEDEPTATPEGESTATPDDEEPTVEPTAEPSPTPTP